MMTTTVIGVRCFLIIKIGRLYVFRLLIVLNVLKQKYRTVTLCRFRPESFELYVCVSGGGRSSGCDVRYRKLLWYGNYDTST